MTEQDEKLTLDLQKEWHSFVAQMEDLNLGNLERSDYALIFVLKKIAILANRIKKVEQQRSKRVK